MILPTSLEEQICKELQDDYSYMMKQQQKNRKKLLQYFRKIGKSSGCYERSFSIKSPNGNKWYALLVLDVRTKKIIQSHCHCVVESAFGTKDYYLWRGHTFGGQYFIRVTSHTIKRIKERCPQINVFNSNEICANLFQPSESGTGLNLLEFKYLIGVDALPDEKDICFFVTTMLGIFIAYQSPGKNLIFKTFITSKMIHSEKEALVYLICMSGHIVQNSHLFTREQCEMSCSILDKYKRQYKQFSDMMCLDP